MLHVQTDSAKLVKFFKNMFPYWLSYIRTMVHFHVLEYFHMCVDFFTNGWRLKFFAIYEVLP